MTGTGPYRIEFTSIPSDFKPSQLGGNHDSAVVFVNDGVSNDIDLSLTNQDSYCQNDPSLVVNCYISGNETNGDVLVDFPWSAGSDFSAGTMAPYENPTTHSIVLDQTDIGPTFGLAYSRRANRIYSAAFFKKHTNFGPGGPDAIYEINPDTNTVTNTFSVPGAVTDSHGTTNICTGTHSVAECDNGNTGWDAVGKTALGGMDISDDETLLYVMNLENRTLYEINRSTGTASRWQSVPGVPNVAGSESDISGSGNLPPGAAIAGDVRPFAVEYYEGKIYVGITTTAESTPGTLGNLRAHVYEIDPADLSFTLRFSLTLNYTRGDILRFGASSMPAEWNAWRTTYATVGSLSTGLGGDEVGYPQPMLAGIAFDNDENLILGIRDRAGDQLGLLVPSNPAVNSLFIGESAGDTVMACGNLTSGFTLESNARCGGVGTGTQSNGQGIGGGEYFHFDNWNDGTFFHDETTLAGMSVLPGRPEMATTVFDPVNLEEGAFSAGARWVDFDEGDAEKAYNLFTTDLADPTTFGKANGLGEIVALCDNAPLQVGNRIWLDTDGDGVQDPGETPIQSVVVELWADTNSDGTVDTQIGTDTTDANGSYHFGGTGADNLTSSEISPAAVHEVRIASSNFNGGQPLNNLTPTTPNNDATSNGDERDSDGVVFPGDIVTAQFTTGDYGENDFSFDFGFVTTGGSSPNHSIGNRVWYDTDNDGIIDGTEVGISGISVSLFADADSNGTPDTPGSPVGTVTTDANGYYRFDGLAAGDYVVRINPSNFTGGAALEGYSNTTGNNTADAESSGAGSNAENGINPSVKNSVLSDGILSNTITLSANAEPTSEADVPTTGSFSGQGAFDDFADMTVDFGFYCLTLSGTVWNDQGAGADEDDGELDVGETLLAGYTLRLFDSSNNEIPVGPDGILGTADDANGGMLSDLSGDYAFSCIPEDTYRVVLTPSGTTSSTPTETDPNLNVDNNDNGFPDNTGNFSGQFISGLITLTPGSTGGAGNNTVTNANGTTSDPTVDFGLILSATAVKLDKVSVYRTKSGVNIEWSTGDESSNLGFNVYRTSGAGEELVNDTIIAGGSMRTNAPVRQQNGTYSWKDETPTDSDTTYILEDIDLDGTVTRHGPYPVETGFSDFEFWKPSSLALNDTGRVSKGNQQKITPADVRTSALFDEDNQRVIARSEGVKIFVEDPGIKRISISDLALSGFDTDTPVQNWQLFENGVEVPIRVIQEAGVPVEIEFYGNGYEDKFTNKQVYYLNNRTTPGIRFENTPITTAQNQNPVSGYRAKSLTRNKVLYVTSILNGDEENWFGQPVLSSRDTVERVRTDDPVLDSPNAPLLRVRLQGLTDQPHLVDIKLGQDFIGTASLSGKENREFLYTLLPAQIVDGENEVTLRSVGSGADVSLVDEIEIEFTRAFEAVEDRLEFFVNGNEEADIRGFSSDNILLYEIDQVGRILGFEEVEGVSNGTSFGFSIPSSLSGRRFVAVESVAYESPALLEYSKPDNLSTFLNEADVLLITDPAFFKPAEGIQIEKKIARLEARIVHIDDVYDEFNFGRKSVESIRAFIEHTRNEWRTGPRYVILLGDSSYDMKNYSNQQNKDLIPTKLLDISGMETASDGWLTDFDNDGVEDIPIGRLPAADLEEASEMYYKTERHRYQQERVEEKASFVSDNGFRGFNEELASELPSSFEIIQRDRSEVSDPIFGLQIVDDFNDENMVVTFTGHGTPGGWASTSIFSHADAYALENERLSMVLAMTCLTGYNHDANVDSLSESLLKSSNGAIAVWSSSGTSYANDQLQMSRHVIRDAFDGQNAIGDVIRQAKLGTTDIDARRSWQLLGDPSIVLK